MTVLHQQFTLLQISQVLSVHILCLIYVAFKIPLIYFFTFSRLRTDNIGLLHTFANHITPYKLIPLLTTSSNILHLIYPLMSKKTLLMITAILNYIYTHLLFYSYPSDIISNFPFTVLY